MNMKYVKQFRPHGCVYQKFIGWPYYKIVIEGKSNSGKVGTLEESVL